MEPNRDPVEQAAVVTTIVGGRPPGAGQPVGRVPRGIEVLVKKAAVDAEFRALLLERRGEAAAEIALSLDPAEAMMLAAVPADQLEAIIARTAVPEEHRRTFLGRAAAAMLATLGMVSIEGCGPKGIKPDRPPEPKGIAPDRPGAKRGSGRAAGESAEGRTEAAGAGIQGPAALALAHARHPARPAGKEVDVGEATRSGRPLPALVAQLRPPWEPKP